MGLLRRMRLPAVTSGPCRRRLAVAAAAVAVAAVVAGVVVVRSRGGDGRNEEDRWDGWDEIAEPAGLRPLPLSAEPVWSSRSGEPLPAAARSVVVGDIAVLVGGPSVVDGELAVVDVATGDARWHLGEDDPLPGGTDERLQIAEADAAAPAVVRHGDGWAVAVPYIARDEWYPRTGFGVAALSLDDGHRLWTARLGSFAADSADDDRHVRTLVASERTVLAVVDPSDEEPVAAARVRRLRIVALDPADGSTRWEAEGVRPAAIAGEAGDGPEDAAGRTTGRTTGETVLAQTAGSPLEPVAASPPPGTTVVALDAATGRRRWDLQERYRWSSLLAVAGDLAVIGVRSPGPVPQGRERHPPMNLVVIEVATGREIGRLETRPTSCASDQETLMACQVRVSADGDERLATIDVETRRTGLSARETSGLGPLVTIHAGRIVGQGEGASYGDLRGGPPRFRSVDRSGTVVDELPGFPVRFSDRYALFACGGGWIRACRGEREAPDRYEPWVAAYRLEDGRR
ncbi:MAG TPA: PQQ-binding-like beta-propeller repeat protein [Acidimicrobiales bacterium]